MNDETQVIDFILTRDISVTVFWQQICQLNWYKLSCMSSVSVLIPLPN